MFSCRVHEQATATAMCANRLRSRLAQCASPGKRQKESGPAVPVYTSTRGSDYGAIDDIVHPCVPMQPWTFSRQQELPDRNTRTLGFKPNWMYSHAHDRTPLTMLEGFVVACK